LFDQVGPASGRKENKQPRDAVLKLALFFLIVSIIAGLFGFTGISAAAAGIAKVLFFIFIVAFVVFLILGLWWARQSSSAEESGTNWPVRSDAKKNPARCAPKAYAPLRAIFQREPSDCGMVKGGPPTTLGPPPLLR